jgi:exodeoxyribonuclease VIII
MKEYRPGIYTDIPFEEYNALPYLRNSYLKKLGSSCPAAAQIDNGDSPAMAIGRASHAFILEGETEFNKSFLVLPADMPKKPTAAQVNAKKPSPESIYAVEMWNRFAMLAGNKEIISADDFAVIKGMKESIRSHDFARTLLKEGVSEQTAIFELVVAGQPVLCKVRPDRTPSTKMAVLLDLKTCADASYRGFLNACYKFGYFHQAAMYIDGYNSAREVMIADHGWNPVDNPPMDSFAFIAVEKTPPYCVAVYTLMGDNSLLIEGRSQLLQNVATELNCRRMGYYPAYQDAGAQELLPYSER